MCAESPLNRLRTPGVQRVVSTAQHIHPPTDASLFRIVGVDSVFVSIGLFVGPFVGPFVGSFAGLDVRHGSIDLYTKRMLACFPLSMRVDTKRKLFVGVRVDGRMREQLEKCPPRDRMYFESTDGRYLQVYRSEKDQFIGKVFEPGLEARSVEDIRRNVWSLLQRVCPGRRDEGEIRLYALDSIEPTMLGEPATPLFDDDETL